MEGTGNSWTARSSHAVPRCAAARVPRGSAVPVPRQRWFDRAETRLHDTEMAVALVRVSWSTGSSTPRQDNRAASRSRAARCPSTPQAHRRVFHVVPRRTEWVIEALIVGSNGPIWGMKVSGNLMPTTQPTSPKPGARLHGAVMTTEIPQRSREVRIGLAQHIGSTNAMAAIVIPEVLRGSTMNTRRDQWSAGVPVFGA